SVVIEERAFQSLRIELRRETQRFIATQSTMAREVVPPSQQIVKPQSQPHLQRAIVVPPRIFVDRNDEWERPGESRSGLCQDRAFAKSFGDEGEVEMFQVPQPAVDEFGRAAGCACGEITLFDQRDTQATRRRVKRQTGSGYPAADDQNVENFFGEFR